MAFYSFEEDGFADSPLDYSLNDSFASLSGENEETYTKVKVLGRGAFGEAVLYRKTITDELVVWKEINLRRASDKERSEALNEVEILSQLDHLNVVAYYNDFFDGSSLFIEMEYANDGSLHHKIVSRGDALYEENEVLHYSVQLISAVSYIHSFGILHRDIKTLNIFMTKSKMVKLGDFGISKVLEETYGAAKTCVGTPYYMSPELVRGESYNQKSDIWACGCVIYELLTLKKVFQASNQLKLITSIINNDPDDISGNYSSEIKEMVRSMLEKDSALRPTAENLMSLSLFDEAKKNVKKQSAQVYPFRRISSQRSISSVSSDFVPVVTSQTSDVFCWGGGANIPKRLDTFKEGSSGIQVSAGFSHFAVVTIEKELYTWANVQGGMDIVGQLGHGNVAMYRSPKKVSFFDGIPVKQVACGEDFTIILTVSGELYACGSDYFGCLGVDNACGDKVLTPVRIDSMRATAIQSIAVGDSHVIALSVDHDVFTWGCGENGRLGLGSEDDFATPQMVQLPARHSSIVSITCGRDNTFILTKNKQLLAFGSNEYNKMALNQTVHFGDHDSHDSNKDIVHCVRKPTPVRSLRSYRLVAISAGKSHSAAIDEFGRLFTFGGNRHGQLGVGDNKPKNSPCLVRGDLNGKAVVLCSCGDGFTVVSTKDNHLYSWGNIKNGRLGIDVKGRNIVCSPKPIFGSLHKVASLSSRYWSTIILAEQMLSSKVIHTTLLSISESIDGNLVSDGKTGMDQSDSFQFDKDFVDSLNDGKANLPDSEKQDSYESSTEDGEEKMPAWLEDEIANASYIPLNTGGNNMQESRQESVSQVGVEGSVNGDEEKLPKWLEEELKNSSYVPVNALDHDENVLRNLQENEPQARGTCQQCIKNEPGVLAVRVKELELANLKLQKTVKEQEIIINTLQKERDCYKAYAEKLVEINENLEV